MEVSNKFGKSCIYFEELSSFADTPYLLHLYTMMVEIDKNGDELKLQAHQENAV
jgi:hypothetical protein